MHKSDMINPITKAPVSPINMAAGDILYLKNPTIAPTIQNDIQAALT
jgi:hypothetical protein